MLPAQVTTGVYVALLGQNAVWDVSGAGSACRPLATQRRTNLAGSFDASGEAVARGAYAEPMNLKRAVGDVYCPGNDSQRSCFGNGHRVLCCPFSKYLAIDAEFVAPLHHLAEIGADHHFRRSTNAVSGHQDPPSLL